jgi:hypothetical protein
MWAMPTTTVTIKIPTVTADLPDGVDDWDGSANAPTVTATGVPASILEQTRNRRSPSSQTTGNTRYITGRVPAGTTIAANAIVVDEQSGIEYAVANTRHIQNPVITNDIVLDLVRNDSAAS